MKIICKYASKGKPLTLVGANFARDSRQITEWQQEIVTTLGSAP